MGERLALRGHHQPVTTVAFSPDGSQLVSGGWGHLVCIWELDNLPPRQVGGSEVIQLASGADAIATADTAGAVRVLDPRTGAQRQLLLSNVSVTAFAMTRDGSRVVAGTASGDVQVWDLTSGELRHSLVGHEEPVRAVVAAADGSRAASVSADGSLRGWDLDTGEAVGVVEGPTTQEPVVTISRDGRWAAAAHGDMSARIWALDDSRLAASCFGHRGGITGLAFAPDGSLVSGAEDNTVRVWDPRTGLERTMMLGHWRKVCSLDLDETGRAVSVGGDFTVRVWDLAAATELRSLGGVRIDPFGRPSQAPAEERTGWPKAAPSRVVVTPDGRRALSFYINDDTLRLWDLDAGIQLAAFTGDEVLRRCSLTDDGRSVAGITRSGRLLLLSLEDSDANLNQREE